MGIFHEYFYYHKKFTDRYGDRVIILMQVGSFHEIYSTPCKGIDLKPVSNLMNIALTRKDKSKEVSDTNPALVGVPTLAKDKYVRVLVEDGYTVVIIDQVTSPPDPRREVTSVVSPGTFLADERPDANHLMSIYLEESGTPTGTVYTVGLSVIDLATGQTTLHEGLPVQNDPNYPLDEAVRFLNSFSPKEVAVYHSRDKKHPGKSKSQLITYLELEDRRHHFYDHVEKQFTKLDYQEQFLKKVFRCDGIGSVFEQLNIERMTAGRMSFVLLLDFIHDHQSHSIEQLYRPKIYTESRQLILGNDAVHQLNIVETPQAVKTQRIKSLFDATNETITPLGRRLHRQRLISPDTDPEEIADRHAAIALLLKKPKTVTEKPAKKPAKKSKNQKSVDEKPEKTGVESLLETLRCELREVLDLDRMTRKMALRSLHPFEFAQLLDSYERVVKLSELISKKKAFRRFRPPTETVKTLRAWLKELDQIVDRGILGTQSLETINRNFFRVGCCPEVDPIESDLSHRRTWVDTLLTELNNRIEDAAKKKSEGPKIYLDRNTQDGYFLRTTSLRAKSLKKNLTASPIELDGHTFTVENLTIKEAKGPVKVFFPEFLKVASEIAELEEALREKVRVEYLNSLVDWHSEHQRTLRQMSMMVAELDFLSSAAVSAEKHHYCRPKLVSGEKSRVQVKQLRHAIVEQIQAKTEYIPNDLSIGDGSLNGMLIYGLNSAGKSTLMKALGIAIVMAQAGLYVPAVSMELVPYSALYARITGNDNIFKGMSSFVLEMTELKAILRRADPKTLVIGDEVCRGTEPISAVSIVAASLCRLSKVDASFVFATHLHQIVEMEEITAIETLKPFHLTVDCEADGVLRFDRKLKPGSGPAVYGVTVAKQLIDDDEFIGEAQRIQRRLLKQPEEFHSSQTSRYNSKLYLDRCQVCQIELTDETGRGRFDTHHIVPQHEFEDGVAKNKPHLKKNSLANLTVLCKKCHVDAHHDRLEIEGYEETSKGRRLKYTKKKRQSAKAAAASATSVVSSSAAASSSR